MRSTLISLFWNALPSGTNDRPPKGLLFLEWIAERAEAEFLLKTDDDEPWHRFGKVTLMWRGRKR